MMNVTTIRPLLLMLLMGVAADGQARSTVCINWGWTFHRGDTTAEEATPTVAQPSFDDSGWRRVDLPHDYQIEQEWVEPTDEEKKGSVRNQPLRGRGFKALNVGWYRKTLELDPTWKGQRIHLDVGGIMYIGDVWLNGVKLGSIEYGYLGKEFDLTDHIDWDGPNVVAVRADNRLHSRWYTGGGLYRNVHLTVKHPIAVARHGLFVSTPSISKEKAAVTVQVEVDNMTGETQTVQAAVAILDPDGKQVANGVMPIESASGCTTAELSLTVAKPQLWSCETPRLYTATVTLQQGGGPLDRISDRFGIRTLEWIPDRGFVLNGKTVKFKGINVHHCFGALGAATYEAAIEARFKVFKEMGINGIRLAHNPYAESYMKLADKHGILLVAELFDKWEDPTTYRVDFFDIIPWASEEWVKACRNRASVILYSLGNEICSHQVNNSGKYKQWGVKVFEMLKGEAVKYDATRPFTVGHFPSRFDGIRREAKGYDESTPPNMAYVSDVVSYNYEYRFFEKDRERYPDWVFFQSEATTRDAPANYYGMPDWSVGLAYWGALMYLGESHGWPSKGWRLSFIDLSLEPMPLFHLMRSVFRDEPMVHIAVRKGGDNSIVWNDVRVGLSGMREDWNRSEGSTAQVVVWSNAEEVELLLNGQSLGTKPVEKRHPGKRNSAEWTVDYQPGELKAVARSGGRQVAAYAVETVGEPAALTLEADNPAWQSDGLDLQHVRVRAVDKQGRTVTYADDHITFRVEGPARLIAVDNGDLDSSASYIADHRHLYKGTALAILRAGKTPGRVVLTATAKGLPTATLQVSTRQSQ